MKLAVIEAEARRLAGRIRPQRAREQGEALRALCEARWLELRGDAPQAPP